MGRPFDLNIPQDWAGWWFTDAGYAKTVYSVQELIDMGNQGRRALRDVLIDYYEYLWDEDVEQTREWGNNRNQIKFYVDDMINAMFQKVSDDINDGADPATIFVDSDNRPEGV